MNLTILTHEDCLGHEPGEGHPEKPERLRKVTDRLRALAAAAPGDIVLAEGRTATSEQVARAHDRNYVDFVIGRAPREGLAALDEDTKMSPGSLAAALAAAGTACHAVDLVMRERAPRAFCAVRPPGHHAFYDRSMGFCIFNNVAVAAAHAANVYGLKRVAIVDFDVHHGNGTQDIVQRHLKDACLVSLQEKNLWPYNDSEQVTAGNILNIGFARGAPAALWRIAMRERVLPFLKSYGPELIIISAGFDAHRDDPPAETLFNDPPGKQNLLDGDYAALTADLMEAAQLSCGGRLVSCMEGGYNTDVLAGAAAAHAATLAGIPFTVTAETGRKASA